MTDARKPQCRLRNASIFGAFLLWSASLSAQTSFASFDAPDAGTNFGQGTLPAAINSKGAIAGTYYDSSNIGHGFVRQANGEITEFTPNLTNVAVFGINNPGQIVGSGIPAVKGVFGVAFQRSAAGHIVIFAPAGSIFAMATGINDGGTAVGLYVDAANGWHGFLRYASGVITAFDDPDANISNGTGTDPIAINNNGAITGYYNDKNTGTQRAFIRDQFGNFTNFDVSPDGQTCIYPTAINLSGEVAGWYCPLDGPVLAYGFLRDASGNITYLGPAQSAVTEALGMNDNGLAVGYWQNSAGYDLGFERNAAGVLTSFRVPFTNNETVAVGINNNGVVAGFWLDTNEPWHGFVK